MADAAYNGGNTTGFVSPAADSIESSLDLGELLDLRQPNRYPVRVTGNALACRGVLSGDILIVDTAIPPTSGRLAVVMLDGETMVGTLIRRQRQWHLSSEQAERQHLVVQGDGAEIWGIVTGLVRPEM